MTEPDDHDGRAPRYRDLFADEHDHGPECAYCPVCTAIALVRRSRPEVVEHLAGAAREIVLALGIILEEAEERLRAGEKMSQASGRGRGRSTSPTRPDAPNGSKLRKIDIG